MEKKGKKRNAVRNPGKESSVIKHKQFKYEAALKYKILINQ